MRTAWAWAKALTDAEESCLQCNITNGGDNQRAQLLVQVDTAQDTSLNVLELCQETNGYRFSMRQEAAIQAAELRTAFAEMP